MQSLSSMSHISRFQPSALEMEILMNISLQDLLAAKHKDKLVYGNIGMVMKLSS